MDYGPGPHPLQILRDNCIDKYTYMSIYVHIYAYAYVCAYTHASVYVSVQVICLYMHKISAWI